MFPIGDDNRDRKTFPLVTYALIGLNALFFFVELSGGDAFVLKWAFVPRRFLADPFADARTLFSSMFMHAGGFTWAATCFTSGSSATTLKTASGISGI